jgi:membrane protein implicated in regulation of membrane protease activity
VKSFRFISGFILLLFFLVATPYSAMAQTEYAEGKVVVYVVVAFVTVFAILIFVVQRNRGNRKEEQAIKSKIHELRASGQELHVNRVEPLTEEDIEILNQHIKSTLWLLTIVLLLAGLAFVIFGNGFFTVIGIAVILLIYPARRYTRQGFDKVLTEGTKHVIRGIITDRYTTTSGSSKSRTTHHWIKLGEIKLEISSSQYTRYAVGDAAEFHTVDYPKGKPLILKEAKLEGAGLR